MGSRGIGDKWRVRSRLSDEARCRAMVPVASVRPPRGEAVARGGVVRGDFVNNHGLERFWTDGEEQRWYCK